MLARALLCVIACATFAATADAQIIDYAKYPNLGGQWRPIGGPGRFDISKPGGRGQQAPLTAEYQAIFEANLKDQAAGGQGTTSTYQCLSPGMPRVTNAYGETEFIITPDTTIPDGPSRRSPHFHRRGAIVQRSSSLALAGLFYRQMARQRATETTTFSKVEARGFQGRAHWTAADLRTDNQTVVRRRIFIDQSDQRSRMTRSPSSTTRVDAAWTVMKNYRRVADRDRSGPSECESNNHVVIANQHYVLSADGLLMPAQKDQPPPDLRYFKPKPKRPALRRLPRLRGPAKPLRRPRAGSNVRARRNGLRDRRAGPIRMEKHHAGTLVPVGHRTSHLGNRARRTDRHLVRVRAGRNRDLHDAAFPR